MSLDEKEKINEDEEEQYTIEQLQDFISLGITVFFQDFANNLTAKNLIEESLNLMLKLPKEQYTNEQIMENIEPLNNILLTQHYISKWFEYMIEQSENKIKMMFESMKDILNQSKKEVLVKNFADNLFTSFEGIIINVKNKENLEYIRGIIESLSDGIYRNDFVSYLLNILNTHISQINNKEYLKEISKKKTILSDKLKRQIEGIQNNSVIRNNVTCDLRHNVIEQTYNKYIKNIDEKIEKELVQDDCYYKTLIILKKKIYEDLALREKTILDLVNIIEDNQEKYFQYENIEKGKEKNRIIDDE